MDTILRDVNAIEEALTIICDRMNPDDRIADALLREIMDCISDIQEAIGGE